MNTAPKERITCDYIYKKTDKVVLSGKRKAGNKCAGFQHGLYKPYCIGHAIQLGLRSKQAHGIQIQKARIARKENAEKRRIVNEGKIPDESNKKEEIFDLKTYYESLKDTEIDKNVDRSVEKWCFAAWLEHKDHKRLPRFMDQVAEIFDISFGVLNVWFYSPLVAKYRERYAVEKNEEGLPALWMARLREGIEGGDKICLKIYAEYMKNRKSDSQSPEKVFPKEIWEEAEKINDQNNDKKISLRGTSRKIKEKMIENALFNGDISKEPVQ